MTVCQPCDTFASPPTQRDRLIQVSYFLRSILCSLVCVCVCIIICTGCACISVYTYFFCVLICNYLLYSLIKMDVRFSSPSSSFSSCCFPFWLLIEFSFSFPKFIDEQWCWEIIERNPKDWRKFIHSFVVGREQIICRRTLTDEWRVDEDHSLSLFDSIDHES